MAAGKKLLIAGGGTGGHIFPGVAVAEKWSSEGGDVVFVGTPYGKEKDLVPRAGFTLKFISVGQLKGRGVFRKIKTLFGLPVSLIKAALLLKSEAPDAVLGIGGYVSGPTTLAARFMGYRTAITDQNAYPGLTNRILGRFVERIYLAFQESASFFKPKKVLYTGNPVRGQMERKVLVGSKSEFCIFIFGGSQGAVGMNRLVLSAFESMGDDDLKEITFIHQAGALDIETVKAFYENKGLKATVSSFFDDMNSCYQKAS